MSAEDRGRWWRSSGADAGPLVRPTLLNSWLDVGSFQRDNQAQGNNVAVPRFGYRTFGDLLVFQGTLLLGSAPSASSFDPALDIAKWTAKQPITGFRHLTISGYGLELFYRTSGGTLAGSDTGNNFILAAAPFPTPGASVQLNLDGLSVVVAADA